MSEIDQNNGILYVPLLAMVKIVAMHSGGLEPVGFLMGPTKDKMPNRIISSNTIS